jgi:hypothetical protein
MLTDRLKNKTTEAETLISKLHRVQEFTLKEYEAKFLKMNQSILEMSNELNIKDQELISAKEEFQRKTLEVAESL